MEIRPLRDLSMQMDETFSTYFLENILVWNFNIVLLSSKEKQQDTFLRKGTG